MPVVARVTTPWSENPLLNTTPFCGSYSTQLAFPPCCASVAKYSRSPAVPANWYRFAAPPAPRLPLTGKPGVMEAAAAKSSTRNEALPVPLAPTEIV